jgi:flagellar biosynthetic protein FliR
MMLEALLTRWAPVFLVVFVRCSGVVLFGPVFSSRMFPPAGKAGLAGTLAILLAPALRAQGFRFPSDGVSATATLLGEFAIGAVLGLAVRFTFAGISLAGELAAVQMGAGLPAVLDPQTMTQVSSVSQFLDQIAILTFLAVGGHHAVLAALAQSFTLAPPLSVGYSGHAMQFLMGLFGSALTLAVRMAAPVGAAMLVTMVTLGLLHRVAPQVNVFMVSFTLTIGVGLLVLLFALPTMGAVMISSYRELPTLLPALLGRMRHGL